MTPGNQATQGIHAALQYAVEHPEETSKWYNESNYLVFLAARDKGELEVIRDKYPCTETYEPDFDGQPLTAIALIDDGRGLSSLPLALKK